jgi:hypothetical protein
MYFNTAQTQPEYSYILLSYATRILVLDCTSSIPLGNKITKICNTAKYIQENIKKESHHDIDIIPVIVSSEAGTCCFPFQNGAVC